MIPRVLEQEASERCTSADWADCPFAEPLELGSAGLSTCPFLHESLVQFCAASPATKFIPYSESVLSRCGTEAFRYCELYLAMAHMENTNPPAPDAGNGGECDDETGESVVAGVMFPPHLYYSTNHMWLDRGESGYCHVGIDAFLTMVLGHVDNLDFVEGREVEHPTIVLSVNGVDLQMVFPGRLRITGKNTYLRSFPQRVVSYPYTVGWLFQSNELSRADVQAGEPVCAHLIRGDKAADWMRAEMHRLSTYVHERINHRQMSDECLTADGGTFCPGLAQYLDRQEILKLYNDFFSPYASRRRFE